VEDGDQAAPATITSSTTAVPPTTAPTTTTTSTTTTTTSTTTTSTTSTTTMTVPTTTTVPPTTTTTVPPTTTTVPPTTDPGAAVVPPADRGSGPGAGPRRAGTTGGRHPGGPAPSPEALAEPVHPVDASAMFRGRGRSQRRPRRP
jgi:hypothetical protein